MSGRTISGVVPARLHEIAQHAAEYEGTSMSALVSSALTFYLGLSGAARRTARYVLTSGSPADQDAVTEGCGRAIAAAGDRMLRAQLEARGQAMGLADPHLTDADIEQEASEAVRAVRARETSPAR